MSTLPPFQKIASIDTNLLDAILAAGGWTPAADDNGGHERLPETLSAHLANGLAIDGTPSQAQLANCGLLVLTLAVAEWGVSWTSVHPPPDPAGQDWAGPPSIRMGKHLMSYALGGIGLPHLDVGGAVRFFGELARRVPAAKPDLEALSHGFRYDSVRARGGVCAPAPANAVLMTDLNDYPFEHGAPFLGGDNYCTRFNPSGTEDIVAWQRLRHWCRVGLRRRDLQEWVVLDWLNSVWAPSYNGVAGLQHGSLREATVMARIRNSSRGDAFAALAAAGSETEPARRVAAELASYAKVSQTHASRVGIMQRPLTIIDALGRP